MWFSSCFFLLEHSIPPSLTFNVAAVTVIHPLTPQRREIKDKSVCLHFPSGRRSLTQE